MAETYVVGEVYAMSGNAKVGMMVSVRMGLTPKVIRFPTDKSWTVGEQVYVSVSKTLPESPDFVAVKGATID